LDLQHEPKARRVDAKSPGKSGDFHDAHNPNE